MKATRAFHKESITSFKRKTEERKDTAASVAKAQRTESSALPSSSADEISAAFSQVVVPKKRRLDDLYKPSKKQKKVNKRDDEFYIPYAAPDKHTEDGYDSLQTLNFENTLL